MKSVHIDFVEDRSWRFVWLCAGLLILGILGVFAWHAWQAERAAGEIRERIAAAQARLAQLQAPVARAIDPRHASAAQAAKILQQDPNKPFAVVENLEEAGARLQALSLDSASDTLRLEYELASVAGASSVSAALNAGYERGPWRLESLNVVAKGASVGVVAPAQAAVRGIWSAQLSAL